MPTKYQNREVVFAMPNHPQCTSHWQQDYLECGRKQPQQTQREEPNHFHGTSIGEITYVNRTHQQWLKSARLGLFTILKRFESKAEIPPTATACTGVDTLLPKNQIAMKSGRESNVPVRNLFNGSFSDVMSMTIKRDEIEAATRSIRCTRPTRNTLSRQTSLRPRLLLFISNYRYSWRSPRNSDTNKEPKIANTQTHMIMAEADTRPT